MKKSLVTAFRCWSYFMIIYLTGASSAVAQSRSHFVLRVQSTASGEMTAADYSAAVRCGNAILVGLRERANAGNSLARELLRTHQESVEIMATATNICLQAKGIRGVVASADLAQSRQSTLRPNWVIPEQPSEPWIVGGLLLDRYSGFDGAGNMRPQTPLAEGEVAAILRCVREFSSVRRSALEGEYVTACLASAGHQDLFVIARVTARESPPGVRR